MPEGQASYMLIQVSTGRAPSVVLEIREMSLIAEADQMIGPYDVIVKTHPLSDEDRVRVHDAIEAIDGVNRILPILVVKDSSS